MKKMTISFFVALFSLIGLQAQEPVRENKRIDVFVYADPSIKTPLNALRAELIHELVNGADSSYVVTDRTDEIWQLLRQEMDYQESGYVRDDQLLTIGEHFGASFLCAVGITHYQEYEQYFIEGTVIDNTRRTIEKHSYDTVESLDPQTQLRAGENLAKQLGLIVPAKEPVTNRVSAAYVRTRVRCR